MPTKMQQLLMISNSQTLVEELRAILKPEGITLEAVASRSEAKTYLAEKGLPLGILIDLQTVEDGLSFCDEMTLFAGLPVIIIGPDSLDILGVKEALTCGDSYIRQSESTAKELAIRFTRLLSRLSSAQHVIGHTLALANNIMINFTQRTADIEGQKIDLTPIEVALLHVLAVHQGEMVDNDTLIERVWRGASEGNPNSLRVHMHRLRKKLKWQKGQKQPVIRTVRGIGYLLQRPS